MTALQYIEFPCLTVTQPLGEFYVGAIDAADLAAIAHADMRRIVEGSKRDIEEFSGIQRPLSKARVTELSQYVTTVDASFPTSIILDIRSEDAEFRRGVMRIKRAAGVAKIIDGQHRIAGLQDYKGPQFQLNVTIFIDMDMEDQALLFATINLKQTRVNKSLAYDLYEFAEARSPQKTCHNIARLLNSRSGSPFYQRIKILGSATAGREETITQAAFVDQVIPLITDNAMRDRDALKRGQRLPEPSAGREAGLIFRELFKGEKDAEIAKNIWNFFSAVSDRWPKAWREVTPGLVLNRTTGLIALIRFMAEIYKKEAIGGVVGKANYASVLHRVRLDAADFTKERFVPGGGGPAALYTELMRAL